MKRCNLHARCQVSLVASSVGVTPTFIAASAGARIVELLDAPYLFLPRITVPLPFLNSRCNNVDLPALADD